MLEIDVGVCIAVNGTEGDSFSSGITCGLYGMMPVALKPFMPYSHLYPCLHTMFINFGKSFFVTTLLFFTKKSEATESYAFLRGLNTATSSGCNKCVQCEGNIVMWMSFSTASWHTSYLTWDSCPSRSRRIGLTSGLANFGTSPKMLWLSSTR